VQEEEVTVKPLRLNSPIYAEIQSETLIRKGLKQELARFVDPILEVVIYKPTLNNDIIFSNLLTFLRGFIV
jgi:hypothetical protein